MTELVALRPPPLGITAITSAPAASDVTKISPTVVSTAAETETHDVPILTAGFCEVVTGVSGANDATGARVVKVGVATVVSVDTSTALKTLVVAGASPWPSPPASISAAPGAAVAEAARRVGVLGDPRSVVGSPLTIITFKS